MHIIFSVKIQWWSHVLVKFNEPLIFLPLYQVSRPQQLLQLPYQYNHHQLQPPFVTSPTNWNKYYLTWYKRTDTCESNKPSIWVKPISLSIWEFRRADLSYLRQVEVTSQKLYEWRKLPVKISRNRHQKYHVYSEPQLNFLQSALGIWMWRKRNVHFFNSLTSVNFLWDWTDIGS